MSKTIFMRQTERPAYLHLLNRFYKTSNYHQAGFVLRFHDGNVLQVWLNQDEIVGQESPELPQGIAHVWSPAALGVFFNTKRNGK